MMARGFPHLDELDPPQWSLAAFVLILRLGELGAPALERLERALELAGDEDLARLRNLDTGLELLEQLIINRKGRLDNDTD